MAHEHPRRSSWTERTSSCITRQVMESRSGRDTLDRRAIRAALLAAADPGALAYEHLLPHKQPGLWLADAFAWAAGPGTSWLERCRPMLEVRQLAPGMRKARPLLVRGGTGLHFPPLLRRTTSMGAPFLVIVNPEEQRLSSASRKVRCRTDRDWLGPKWLVRVVSGTALDGCGRRETRDKRGTDRRPDAALTA